MVPMDESAALVSHSVSLEQSGTTLTFEAFFESESSRLFRAARLLTGSHEEAEELCQEAFFKVWQRWDRVGTMDNPAGYLYRTALNDYRKWHRRALLKARQVLRPTSPEDPQLTIEARDTFARWLGRLTPRQRSAVVLTAWLGFSTEHAADAMQVKPGTIHVLLSQARSSLKEAVRPDHA
jgi:RNA polymerase sigma factor (sigma-70 family)